MKSLFYIILPVILFLTSCSTLSQPADTIPDHKTFTIQSHQVQEERIINVWTPDSYTTSSEALPVLYMADGGVKEDFPHIANTLSDLIQSGKIPPFILVGIENTQRRRDLTGFTEVEKDKKVAPVVGGSDKFRSFIYLELIPEINKRYRTTTEKGIIGESLSGLFVIETFLLHPEMFDFYIAFDPSLWWNDRYLVKVSQEHLSGMPKEQQKKLWYAGSGATDIAPVMKELKEILETHAGSNLKWKYSDEPKEEHHTIFRATKEKALIWTLGKNG